MSDLKKQRRMLAHFVANNLETMSSILSYNEDMLTQDEIDAIQHSVDLLYGVCCDLDHHENFENDIYEDLSVSFWAKR